MWRGVWSLLCVALLAVSVCVCLPTAAQALVVSDDFESYPAGHVLPLPPINGQSNGQFDWQSEDSRYGVGWIVCDDHPAVPPPHYLRFWPSPLFLFDFPQNSVTCHVKAARQVTSLRFSMDYFIQIYGDCQIGLSADGSNWTTIADSSSTSPLTLALEKRPPSPPFDPEFDYAECDLSDLISQVGITSDVYLRFRARARSYGDWVTGIDRVQLEFESQLYANFAWLPPLVNADKKFFKRGSTIPVKFRISDLNGDPVSDCVAALEVFYWEPGAEEGEPEVVCYSNGRLGNTFRYDARSDLYIFNLSTRPWQHLGYKRYQIVVTLDDGQQFDTYFSLR